MSEVIDVIISETCGAVLACDPDDAPRKVVSYTKFRQLERAVETQVAVPLPEDLRRFIVELETVADHCDDTGLRPGGATVREAIERLKRITPQAEAKPTFATRAETNLPPDQVRREALRQILGWRELRSGANEVPIELIEEIAREALNTPDVATPLPEDVAELRKLIVHCWIHEGYRNCGYEQMTTEQRRLYDSIVENSEAILEGKQSKGTIPEDVAKLVAEAEAYLTDAVTQPHVAALIRRMIAALETQSRERAGESDAEGVLRSLACWLGNGGYNAETVDAAEFERKIRDGVETVIRVETKRAEQRVERKFLAEPRISDDEMMSLLRRVNKELEIEVGELSRERAGLRLKALYDAAKDVCMYCGGRAPQYNTNPVHGPSGSGNWIHAGISGGKPVLCVATPILNRIDFEQSN